MAVRRSPANLPCDDPQALSQIYAALSGPDPVTDRGRIAPLQGGTAPVQRNLPSKAGPGIPLSVLPGGPNDPDTVSHPDRAVIYGPVNESPGVRHLSCTIRPPTRSTSCPMRTNSSVPQRTESGAF